VLAVRYSYDSSLLFPPFPQDRSFFARTELAEKTRRKELEFRRGEEAYQCRLDK